MVKTKEIFSLSLTFCLFIATINFTSATDSFMMCLNKGQVLEFSKCNSLMQDFKCTSTRCNNVCVTEVSPGIYCPGNYGVCNSRGVCVAYSENKNVELPSLSLIEPENYVTLNNGNINFKFNLVKFSEVNLCDLIINSKKVSSLSQLSSGNIFTYKLNEGPYLWEIECSVKTGEKISSSERVLFIKSNQINSETNSNNLTNNQNTEDQPSYQNRSINNSKTIYSFNYENPNSISSNNYETSRENPDSNSNKITKGKNSRVSHQGLILLDNEQDSINQNGDIIFSLDNLKKSKQNDILKNKIIILMTIINSSILIFLLFMYKKKMIK
ncbi:MAG: hypothetical protein QW727_02800 [Candidatus Pacearchaeota archaeon]